MPCKNCGKHYVSGYCKTCARANSRNGDTQDRLGGYDAVTDGGQQLAAKLEDTASQQATEALAAMDARETERAVYHGRQFLQALIGINYTGGES